MHPCPHCHQPTFSSARKALLLWAQPGPCSACYKPAFLPIRNVITAMLVWTLLCWLLIATAIYMRNVLFLFGGIPAAMLVIDKWLIQAPLIAHTNAD
jgi:hypothetical protein